MRTYIIVVILGFSLMNCSKSRNESHENRTATVPTESFTFRPKVTHAEYFTIDVQENYKTVILKNPWENGDTLFSYVLYPRGAAEPNVSWAKFKIPVPIESVVATSSPHVGFLGLIDGLESVTGVADAQYIFNKYIYEKVENNEISHVGALKGNNLEVLLDLSPNLVMKTGMNNVSNDDLRLIEAGIPVSYNVEWVETSLLARAEWIKFIATFFNKDEMADSIFNQIESNYLSLLATTAQVEFRPTIMTGNNFKGTWYMPGSESFLTKLIIDAGGNYPYIDKKSTGSIPLSFEVVLDDLVNADYWIGPGASSMKDLKAQDERYTLFRPFKEGNVYTFDKRVSENGGNDFWESGMTRPDIILKDIIKILHPDLLPDHQLYYYKKLQ